MLSRIELEENYRAIFISDIHGDYQGLLKLLEKINYNNKIDYLFILGDIIEKGPENLKTLRKIMELSEISSKCFALIGNNDDVLVYIKNKPINDNIIRYMKGRSSILNEFAKELNIKVDDSLDLNNFYNLVLTKFEKEIEFVAKLPSIIATKDFLLAHAGLYPNDNYLETDYDYATSHDEHNYVDYHYPVPLIVGHWTPGLYGKTLNVNPLVNLEKNIYSIDGANSIKEYGQLNALILERKNGKNNFFFECVDNIKETEVINNQKGESGIKIRYPINQIEIIEENEKFITGYLRRYHQRGSDENNIDGKLITIPKELAYQYNDGKYYTQEFGNYLLDLKIGDKVKIINNGGNYLVAKFKGEVALVKKENLRKQ